MDTEKHDTSYEQLQAQLMEFTRNPEPPEMASLICLMSSKMLQCWVLSLPWGAGTWVDFLQRLENFVHVGLSAGPLAARPVLSHHCCCLQPPEYWPTGIAVPGDGRREGHGSPLNHQPALPLNSPYPEKNRLYLLWEFTEVWEK